MTTFTVEVKDQEVLAKLRGLVAKVGKPQPVLQAIGEDIMERAKERFGTAAGPDGARWAPNARTTRFIPAVAGNARFSTSASCSTTVHPRGCGERAERGGASKKSCG